MTDTNENMPESGKTLTLSSLSGGKKPAQQVRQNFQQGRSKAVMVEVKKKRVLVTKDAVATPEPSQAQSDTPQKEKLSSSGKKLTSGELEVRLQALQGAFKAQIEKEEAAAQKEELEAEIRRAEEAVKEALAAERDLAAESQPTPSESPENVEPEIAPTEPVQETPSQGTPAPVPEPVGVAIQPKAGLSFKDRMVNVHYTAKPAAPKSATEEVAKPEEAAAYVDRKKKDRLKSIDEEMEEEAAKKAKKKGTAPVRREGPHRTTRLDLLHVSTDEDDGGDDENASAALRRPRAALPRRMRGPSRVMKSSFARVEREKVIREVIIPESITVQELANRMAVRGADVVKALMKMGMMVSITQTIDADTAEVIVAEFGHTIKRVSDSDVELGMEGFEDTQEMLLARPPVVTVMGHVDHGKTSLLDALRATDVVSGEAGGITQHIGAYQVTLKSGQKITFIDTPGHAAFTEMRARGAHVTDIVVLVVAADDGIKEQTVEAIHHAQAANAPIVVAVNKCDKPGADPARVRQELLQHGIVVEEMGGDVLAIDVSAKQKLNLDKLEEAILLQAEILDLRANPNREAEGVVVEAKLEKGRGPIATILINRGTLNSGDVFVAGTHFGRVRNLIDDHGRKIEKAFPAMPVEIMGFNSVPQAGDKFLVVESEDRAREIAGFRMTKERESKHVLSMRSSMEQLFQQIKEGTAKELAVLVKADVQGSLEAIKSSLEKLSTSEVAVKIIHAGVGAIHESDITLASASQAVIVGFNVRANAQARDLASREKIEIRYYSIIYNMIDDIKKALGGLLSPDLRENFLGYAEIREVFNITKIGNIAGCMITEGIVKRGAKVRLLRDNVVIHEGTLKTLRRFKDEVKEVREGFECGMAFENYHDIRVNDRIECFEIEEIARTL